MIRLNKIASAVLAGTLALSLAACSGDTASSSSAADTSSASTGDTAASGELAEDVQAIVDRGVLRVGVKSDVIGFGYLDPLTNEYSGLEITWPRSWPTAWALTSSTPPSPPPPAAS